MPRFAANLSLLFTEYPLLDRVEAAARAGFEAIEIQFPYDAPVTHWRERLDEHGLGLVLHNLPAGHWQNGDRGIACHPGRVDEFRAGLEQAIAYAHGLGVKQLNCLAGIAPAHEAAQRIHETFIANLQHAASVLKAEGIRLLIEAINTFDIPGFYLNTTKQALEILQAVGSDNLFLQYDVYHMQRMEGELANTLQRHLKHIAHIQIADNPGRHEPGTGEIHFPFLFRHLDDIGYTGWVGCEYHPANGTLEGLGWMQMPGLQQTGNTL